MKKMWQIVSRWQSKRTSAYLPAGAPKSQPSSGDCWHTKKLYPMFKDKREVQIRWSRGVIINQISYWLGKESQIENDNRKSCSSVVKVLLHVRLPSVWLFQRDQEFPGNLILKYSGIWLQDFHRMGETEKCLRKT